MIGGRHLVGDRLVYPGSLNWYIRSPDTVRSCKAGITNGSVPLGLYPFPPCLDVVVEQREPHARSGLGEVTTLYLVSSMP